MIRILLALLVVVILVVMQYAPNKNKPNAGSNMEQAAKIKLHEVGETYDYAQELKKIEMEEVK